ncbi:bifunctional GNAT family N-acetyltransferase/hotdog fold thioesterase [Alteromonas sp. a30]|uniref:bifunctional GNAT family N-acetyltransferase/hotdog fold thioesterase n=1 Tax=Alteromonas sp. a30 TaxID=2730917 RepID=UPI00227E794A|nr:bifunctional GNAT family N-acetyltransferase/thioesterase [Alteromonas sp. a30]MCY7296790.1 GNAT family N-acetyltransferase [Alteromonas sp. a30]
MYKISIPSDEQDLNAYFHFRWQILREPFNLPEGSEKDEYETVAEHRMIKDGEGNVIAVGRVHLNTPEEAQIKHIAVSNDMRGKGLGQMIVFALEEVARKMGVERIVTNSMDTSVEFFRSCGFEVQELGPKELDMQRRQQMLKKLAHQGAVRLHPNWCEELQKTWYETIPITEHMGIKLYQYTGHALEVRASLGRNINLHGTMFAGSIFSLATLTGWGMIFLQMKQKGLAGEIVLGDADIHYHKPVTSEPRAVCNIETMSGDFEYLKRGKKNRLTVTVKIQDVDRAVAEFEGVYWILPETDLEE